MKTQHPITEEEEKILIEHNENLLKKLKEKKKRIYKPFTKEQKEALKRFKQKYNLK